VLVDVLVFYRIKSGCVTVAPTPTIHIFIFTALFALGIIVTFHNRLRIQKKTCISTN